MLMMASCSNTLTPLTGGPTMPTIGCWVQMIPPGETTKAHRHTSSAHLSRRSRSMALTAVGKSKGAAKDLAWGAHDCFFVPSWNWHHFENTFEHGAGDHFFRHRSAGAGKLGLVQTRGSMSSDEHD